MQPEADIDVGGIEPPVDQIEPDSDQEAARSLAGRRVLGGPDVDKEAGRHRHKQPCSRYCVFCSVKLSTLISTREQKQ